MPHVHSRVFYHFVWSTHNRDPLLTGDIEQHAYALIRKQCKKMECLIHAIGGVEDHLHLLVSIPCTLSISDFVESIKGCSARLLNEAHSSETHWFGWQRGYGVHTVSPADVKKITRYIQNQHEHHAKGTTWTSAEDCGDDL